MMWLSRGVSCAAVAAAVIVAPGAAVALQASEGPSVGGGGFIPHTGGGGVNQVGDVSAVTPSSAVSSAYGLSTASDVTSLSNVINASSYLPATLDLNPLRNRTSESYASWEPYSALENATWGNVTLMGGTTSGGAGSTAGGEGTAAGERRGDPVLQPYSTAHLLTTSIILGTMILATIIGNVFVIAAIILERNLHNVGNYLIVSLSVADLMVAALVMPLAAVNEISTQWFLGPEICDMWISFDVLCCTSSILHLVAIAMDRYWAVTQVDYIHNRSAKRILIMIALSWLVGMSISIPPLFGWKEENNDPASCMISQDWGYTIFSTVGAFYLPLFLMLFIYLKVFRAAKSRIRKKNFKALDKGAPRPLLCENNAASGVEVENSTEIVHDMHDGMPLTHISSSNGQSPEHSSGLNSGHSNGSAVHLTSSMGGVVSAGGGAGGGAGADPPPATPPPCSAAVRNNNKHLLSPHLNLAHSTETLTPPASPLLRETGHKGSFLDITKVYFDLKKGGKGSTESPNKKREKEAKAARDRLEQKRERKAARTLAIITGSFVICWLPFFMIALVRPFCGDKCYFHPLVTGIIGWLGYFNSLLNPIIYTVFNPDFRSAFRKILFGKYRGQPRATWR